MSTSNSIVVPRGSHSKRAAQPPPSNQAPSPRRGERARDGGRGESMDDKSRMLTSRGADAEHLQPSGDREKERQRRRRRV
jgi:hypothetical protein